VAKVDVFACVEKTTCPSPAVTASEFSVLYEHCMASGLKAHLVSAMLPGVRLSPYHAVFQF
jgi:hypothetical protein